MAQAGRGRRLAIGAGVLVVAAAAFAAWRFWPDAKTRRDSALIEAAKLGEVKGVQDALDAGADPNARDRDGVTALMHAARGDGPNIDNPGPTDHPEVVELLVKRGADVNARTATGFVALFWAARYGHDGVAKVLISHGADVNAKDRDGVTALMWANTNRQTRVIDMLKEAGAKE